MPWVIVIEDKSKRKIYLSKERWTHINQHHPEMADYFEEIKETIKNPLKVTTYNYDENTRYYYKYFKDRSSQAKYLLVIVKYLNGEGFIITAYFVKGIK